MSTTTDPGRAAEADAQAGAEAARNADVRAYGQVFDKPADTGADLGPLLRGEQPSPCARTDCGHPIEAHVDDWYNQRRLGVCHTRIDQAGRTLASCACLVYVPPGEGF